MDQQRATNTLKKITNLMNSLIGEDTISSIEKDLLLSYTRQFYDAIINEEEKTSSAKVAAPKVIKSSPPVKKVKKEVPYTPPRVVEIPASIKELEKEVIAPVPVKPKAVVTPPPPTPAPTPKTTKPATLPAKYKKVFVFKEPKELSERLSQSPIKDLTKAMAINDRLLFVSELFNNQQIEFGATLNHLNTLSSYDDAIAVLINYAEENDWTDGEKIDTAISFAKLVKRRYK